VCACVCVRVWVERGRAMQARTGCMRVDACTQACKHTRTHGRARMHCRRIAPAQQHSATFKHQPTHIEDDHSDALKPARGEGGRHRAASLHLPLCALHPNKEGGPVAACAPPTPTPPCLQLILHSFHMAQANNAQWCPATCPKCLS